MYLFADLSQHDTPAPSQDPIERELREIEELRERALKSRDFLYCAATVRHLVEKEIPRLTDVIRQLHLGEPKDRSRASDTWLLGALEELRQEIKVVRDLVDRS